MVASHTETPLGVSKWLVRGCPEEYSLPLGRRQGLFGYVPYLKARFYLWVSLSPAISRCLKARLYGWLPLSNAYGIIIVAPPYPIYLYFHVATHDQSINIFRCAPIPNLSIFPRCYLCPIHQHFPLQFIPNLSALFSMQPHSLYFGIPRCRKTIWCLHLSCNNTIFALKHLIYGKHLYPNLLTHHFRRS